MGFWIFMLIMDLLLPFMMIGFGRYFMKKAPKEINSVFGYRTSMSMKNKDTWEFAHKYCGKVWYVCGMVMLPITVIFMLLVIGKNEDCVGSIGGIICGVQLIPLIGSIISTEKALLPTTYRTYVTICCRSFLSLKKACFIKLKSPHLSRIHVKNAQFHNFHTKHLFFYNSTKIYIKSV